MDTQLVTGATPCRTSTIRSASRDAPHQVSRTKDCTHSTATTGGWHNQKDDQLMPTPPNPATSFA
eukprot:909207-Prorocentrum_lima.AAC.1